MKIPFSCDLKVYGVRTHDEKEKSFGAVLETNQAALFSASCYVPKLQIIFLVHSMYFFRTMHVHILQVKTDGTCGYVNLIWIY
jgi:hypothetical protein